MKKTARNLIIIALIITSAISFNSCKKIKKGIVEIKRKYFSLETYFAVIATDGEESGNPGAGIPYDVNIAANNTETRVYWDDESLRSLGYTEKNWDYNGHKDTYKNKKGYTNPGENGYFANAGSGGGNGNGNGNGTGTGTGGCGCPTGENRIFIYVGDYSGSQTLYHKSATFYFTSGSAAGFAGVSGSLTTRIAYAPVPTYPNSYSSSELFTMCYNKLETNASILKYTTTNNNNVQYTEQDYYFTTSGSGGFMYNTNNCIYVDLGI